MVHLVPSISVVKTLLQEIQCGCSVYISLEKAIERGDSEFHQKLRRWFLKYQAGVIEQGGFETDHQDFLVSLLIMGLQGRPIYEHLQALSEDMTEEFDRQWKLELESLPRKLSLPLLLCFFPAYLILLFGPLLSLFLLEVGQ